VFFVVIRSYFEGRYNQFMRASRQSAGVALALWIALAFVVWNVVFDRVLVVAGRQYVAAATRAARGSGPYVRVDDWMRPAVSRATRTASGAAVLILTIGVAMCAVAARRRSAARVKSQVSSLKSQASS
jgi:hypothetical protein